MNTNTSTTPTPTPARRGESVVQAVIMLAVAGMAGAASFTHVHDWTMHNSPPGTGNWFGWANAMVSELIPLAAGLEARRRIRHYGSAGAYPIVLIVAAVALSLTGQFAEATHSISGWLISAVPALGFLALVKLVLSSPRPHNRDTGQRAGTHRRHTIGPWTRRQLRRTRATSCPEGQEGRRGMSLASARFAATNHRRRWGGRSRRRNLPPGSRSRRRSRPVCSAKLSADEAAQSRVNGHRVDIPVGGVR